MLVYSITVGFSPILYCYLIPCRASELLSLQPMFPVGLNIQICVHNISIIENVLSLSARASPLRVLGFLRRSALRVWSRFVSRSYEDSYDSSAMNMPMGVASQHSTLPCAIATLPV